MTIKTIDAAACRLLREELEMALGAVTDNNPGLTIKVGSMTYAGNYATIKLEVAIVDEEGNAQTKEASDFIDYTAMGAYDTLTPDHLWDWVMLHGERYQLIGCKPRSRKYPILGKRADGKIFKLPVATVCAAIKGGKSLLERLNDADHY
jgi:hypothetical protein